MEGESLCLPEDGPRDETFLAGLQRSGVDAGICGRHRRKIHLAEKDLGLEKISDTFITEIIQNIVN